jgi:hypothetical protein
MRGLVAGIHCAADAVVAEDRGSGLAGTSNTGFRAVAEQAIVAGCATGTRLTEGSELNVVDEKSGIGVGYAIDRVETKSELQIGRRHSREQRRKIDRYRGPAGTRVERHAASAVAGNGGITAAVN